LPRRWDRGSQTAEGTQTQEEVHEFRNMVKGSVTIRKTEESILKIPDKYITKIRVALLMQ
jgi:hypothetical protein